MGKDRVRKTSGIAVRETARIDDNKRLAGIAGRNSATQDRIDSYRADAASRTVPRMELESLIRDTPWFGMVPCRAAGVDFVMLHANDDIVARDWLWIGADGCEPDMVRRWVVWCRTPGLVPAPAEPVAEIVAEIAEQ